MAASAILAIKILADAKQASSAMDQSATATSKWSGGLAKASKVATVGLAAVGAVMLSGVKAAADDAQQQAVLAKALQNSAGASKSAVAATEDWITKTSQATGVADDQLRPALGSLVRATGDVAKSQEAMGVALDVSAATGKDVEAVAAALAKGYAGNTSALGRLVPGIDKATIASGDMSAIMDELAAKTGGSAAAAADTAAGKYKIFQNNLQETKEGIGAALLPALTALATQMAGVSEWAQNNSGTLTILLGAFAALAAIVVTVNAVTKAWTAITKIARAAALAWQAAQWLLNAALTANPIGIVIVLVAALVAGLVIAYAKSETFRRIVDAAFRAVKAAAQFAWDWIKEHWPLLLAIITGPIGLAVLAVTKNWDAIKDGAARVLGWFRSSWDALRDIIVAPFETAWSIIQSIIGKIRSAVASVTDAIHKIPTPKIPDLNPFGRSAPATASVGLQRQSAARFRGVSSAPAAARGTTGGSGPSIVIQGALDPEAVARQVQRLLGQHNVRVGRSPAVMPG